MYVGWKLVFLLQKQQYISDMLQPYVPPHSIRSSSENLLAEQRIVSRAGSRAISADAPNLWNSIPQFKKIT